MTTFLLLLASLALVALIGAVLVYAVHRIVTWSVDRVEGRGAVVTSPVPSETPTSATTVLAPHSDAIETAPGSAGPADLAQTPVVPTPVAPTQAAPAASTRVASAPVGSAQAAQPEAGTASTAA